MLVRRTVRRISSYSNDNHTLLPNVFMFRHGQDRVGYLIRQGDKALAIDPGDSHALAQNLASLSERTGSKLSLEAVFMTDRKYSDLTREHRLHVMDGE